MQILQVSQLSISFNTELGNSKAVSNISFSVDSGKTLAIVGESGSGKSVCSLAIMGLLPANKVNIESGEIFFCEKKNILTASSKELELLRGNDIAMIFQEPMSSLNPLMSCGKQVAEAIQLHQGISFDKAKQQVIALFAEVKIPDPVIAFDKHPHEMSGGQKQRVMIAMAICCEPKLLIADEPTTALDASVQNEIIDLLKDIQQRRGTAIIFITHDLALVKNIADDVLVLFKGQCMEYGTVQQVFNQPKNNYTKALIACRPNIAYRTKVLPTVQDFLYNSAAIPFTKQIENEDQFTVRKMALANSAIILEVQNACIRYVSKKNIFGKPTQYFDAVQEIDLQIHRGQTIGIVGESGCGKTTLGKAFVKLNKLSSGSILFNGKNIFTEWDNSYHRYVQIIFQDPMGSLHPRKTIGNAILEPMQVHGIHSAADRKTEVCKLLSKVGMLPEHFDRYPHEFSGGQRQRICIARALAMQPQVIICDESVSALDVSVQAQVLNLLSNLRDEFGLTLIFISHDMNVIRHLSDQIIVMQQGRIIEIGDAYSLFANPQSDYTIHLLATVPQ
jgi:peptide/nickel transport system ATP-binding protein